MALKAPFKSDSLSQRLTNSQPLHLGNPFLILSGAYHSMQMPVRFVADWLAGTLWAVASIAQRPRRLRSRTPGNRC